MKTRRRALLLLWTLLSAGLCILSAERARAGGPLYVGGTYGVPGQPFRWNPAGFPVAYSTDLGNLGLLNNTQANNFTAEAFNVWQDVPTANIAFARLGPLAQDVNASNIAAFLNALGDCSDLAQPTNAVIYDADGRALQALGVDPNMVLGFAGVACIGTDGTNNWLTRGGTLLNGKFIDGQPDSPSNPEISLAEFKAVFIHEFGHLLGLDHAQINVNCLTSGCPPGSDDLQGVPTMFPFLISVEMASLRTDDIAAISSLYPDPSFTASFGKIQGQILFSDGTTPAQGFNVIARQVDDPGTPQNESRRVAASSVSGFLFTACAGNPVTPPPYNDCGGDITPFGSRDQNLIGFYAINVPPGQYTVEVEGIYPSFVGGSSVGPIGNLSFQFPLPGPPEFYSGGGETGTSATDPPASSSAVTVSAGVVLNDINIILNDTPPRFDAWETAWLVLRPASLPWRACGLEGLHWWLRALVVRLDRRFAWTEM